jgi:hypothetical protein
MAEKQNIELVRRGYEAFGRGDIPALLALLDENVEWITPGPTELPTAGRRTGRQAVQEFFQSLAATVDTVRFEAKEFFAQGDRVVVVGDDTSRVKETGRTLDVQWVHLFTVRGDRVVSFQEVADHSALAAELQKAHARV